MSTLFEEIERIKNAKIDIATAIRGKGVHVPDDMSMCNYHELISNISKKPSTFTFTIGDTYYGDIECIAEENMTFGSWLFSDYASELIDTYGFCATPYEYWGHTGITIRNFENVELMSMNRGTIFLNYKIKDSIGDLFFDYSLHDSEEEM